MIRCKRCGKEKDPEAFPAYHGKNCSDCTMPKKLRQTWFKVIWAPHIDVMRGRMFPVTDFRCSLRGGVWPLGMIVERDNGTRYVVCGKGRQDWTAERLQPEWLKEIS